MRSIRTRAALPRRVLLAAVAAVAATWAEPSPRHGRAAPWTTPGVSRDRLALEDKERPGIARIGLPIPAGVTPQTHGRWTSAPEGGRLWKIEVRSPSALWLALGFDRFRLPEGARLTARDASGAALATRTAADVRAHGQLWLPPFAGDTVALELLWPRELRDRTPELRLGTVTHGYEPWGEISAPSGTDCNIDVNCSPEGDAWQAQKRGVVQLFIASSGFACTGSLINNTANLATGAPPFDAVYPAGMRCAPYLLTAAHCFEFGGTAESTTFFFNFDVDPNLACQSGQATGIAPRSQTLTGATTVANWATSDFRLLLLDELPPREFAAFLSGWNRQTTPATEATTIHHPADTGASILDVLPKKITHDSDAPVEGTVFGPQHWKVVDWDGNGTPGPGSSGAPVFDQDRRIIGQVHGGLGETPCSNPPPAEFGKLAASWTGGGTAGTRLSDALAPPAGGSAPVTLDGIDLDQCTTLPPGVTPIGRAVDDDTAFGNDNGVADPGDVLRLQVDLFNGRATPVTGVTATLQSSHPKVTILDGYAAWPDIGQLAADASIFSHFGIDLDGSTVCGTAPLLDLTVTSAEGSWQSSFPLPTGTAGQTFHDDGDSGTNGFTCAPGLCAGGAQWTVSPSWAHDCETSVCPDNAWFISDVLTNTNAALRSPALLRGNLAAGSKLMFRHFMETEISFDGGVLEYSTNGGTLWSDVYDPARLLGDPLRDLIVEGFYDSTIDGTGTSAIPSRPVWSGISGGWRDVVIDLGPFALGAGTLQFRWRFVTDAGGSVPGGWYVDDVRIVGGNFSCQAPASRHFPGAQCRRAGLPGERGFPCGRREPTREPGPRQR